MYFTLVFNIKYFCFVIQIVNQTSFYAFFFIFKNFILIYALFKNLAYSKVLLFFKYANNVIYK